MILIRLPRLTNLYQIVTAAHSRNSNIVVATETTHKVTEGLGGGLAVIGHITVPKVIQTTAKIHHLR